MLGFGTEFAPEEGLTRRITSIFKKTTAHFVVYPPISEQFQGHLPETQGRGELHKKHAFAIL